MVESAYRDAGRQAEMGDDAARLALEIMGPGPSPRIGLDCEAISGLFADSGAVRRKSVDASDTVLNVFDVVPFDAMNDIGVKEIKIPWVDRRAVVDFIVARAPVGSRICTTQVSWADSDDEVQEIYATHRSTTIGAYMAGDDVELRKALEERTIDNATGLPKTLEGSMVKVPGAGYVKAKGHHWMKIKAAETEDLRVVDQFEGEGRLVGKLGGLIVDRHGVHVRVGGGFSDVQRDELWINSQVGRLIEVEFHEVTPDGSLRHPRFVRFRSDKDETLKEAA